MTVKQSPDAPFAPPAGCQQILTSQMRNFSMRADFSHATWRYILLPIYLVTYRYSGKVYQVMINGQTEIMVESKPVDWMKMQKGIKP